MISFLVQTPGPKKVQLLGPSTSTLTVWPHWGFFWSGLKRAGWLTWCPVWAAFYLKISAKNVFCDMPMCISTEQACTKRVLSSGYPALYLEISALKSSYDSWHVHLHFDRAGSHETGVAVGASGIFPVFSAKKWVLRYVHVHFDCSKHAANFWRAAFIL